MSGFVLEVQPAELDCIETKRRRGDDRLDELAQLRPGWAGQGSLPPAEPALGGMRKLLAAVPAPPGNISPGPGGQVQAEWEHGAHRYLELCVEADGSWGYLICDEQGEREGDATYDEVQQLAATYLETEGGG